MSKLSQDKILQVLDWVYEQAIDGVVGMDSASALAKSYMDEDPCIQECANALIRWQNAKAGTSGFIAGLGGILTMPITIPANITSVIYIQVRMIAALAHMGGYDLKSDQVKTLVYACLTGNAAKEILKGIGVNAGLKITKAAIQKIPGKVLIEINKKVTFRLFTKFGEKGVINLGKMVPIAGGIISATFDSVTTNSIGNIARDIFLPEHQANDSTV